MMPENSYHSKEIAEQGAAKLCSAALDEARRQGINISIAVVDNGGHLTAFKRMDKGHFLPVEMAIDKAWTASSLGLPTHVLNDLVTDPKLAPIAQTPRFVPVGGGYPLFTNGIKLGGIGISGGSYEEDQILAEYALRMSGFDV